MLTIYDLDLKNMTKEKLEQIWDYLDPKDQQILEIKLSLDNFKNQQKGAKQWNYTNYQKYITTS